MENPLDQNLREAATTAREVASTALVDLLLMEHRGQGPASQSADESTP
jgi:hypothetical protein